MTDKLFQDDPQPALHRGNGAWPARRRASSSTAPCSTPAAAASPAIPACCAGTAARPRSPTPSRARARPSCMFRRPAHPLPPPGATVQAEIDWDRRHKLMRMHTALHLLCSVIKGAAVTGGSVGADRSRLDFDLPNPPPKQTVEAGLNALIDADHPVRIEWVDEAVLDANPDLVRTMSVQPPRGAGRLRLMRIGDGRCAGGSATLRRHPRRAHRRDRPHGGCEDREQRQAEPPHHHRAGEWGVGPAQPSRHNVWHTFGGRCPPVSCPGTYVCVARWFAMLRLSTG